MKNTPQVESDFYLTRWMYLLNNAGALFLIVVANHPSFGSKYTRNTLKLIIPFYTTYNYVQALTALAELENAVPMITPGALRVKTYITM
jgi:hypothetical protein